MKYGMVKVGAFTPHITIGAPLENAIELQRMIARYAREGVEIAVFPELCVTGYTAMDLFFTQQLLSETVEAIKRIAKKTPQGMLAIFGAPIAYNGRLYNCAVGVSDGKILGAVPKSELPDYCEFFEKRYFTPAFDGVAYIDDLDGMPFGNVLFECGECDKVVVACEICEDMWTDVPPSVQATRAGATIVCNLSASDETVGKAEYRRLLVAGASGRQHCAYVYADAGEGESSTDVVFSGHNIIAENGAVLAESLPFSGGVAITDIDVDRLDCERRKIGVKPAEKRFVRECFSLSDKLELTRKIEPYPFVPSGDETARRAELILSIQAQGLKTRFDATGLKKAVIGVSGGLDSALALLVAARAVDKDMILPVTMPCFGTSDRTLDNAKKLCAALGLKLRTVDIKATVTSHLKDIDHGGDADVTYENAQARTRTMTLFDIANAEKGLVVGTGDLSELALGWATYNGDHMSNYGVNAGVPKTLVKHLVSYEAKRLGGKALKALEGILDTPISPELKPTDSGEIAQKTEDILGKYDLMDFIIYYHVRYGFDCKKINFLLEVAFPQVPKPERDKALSTFYARFNAAQFKRSCLPDGVKIGSVSFSPRSDFRLPSDIKY